MVHNFKVSLRVCGLSDATAIYFKPDGGRFQQPNTVKLCKDTDFSMSFTLKTKMYIDKLMVNGELHKLELVKSKNDEYTDGRTYKMLFSTKGFDVTNSGKWREILIGIEVIVRNGVYMKLTLQCKVYAPGDKSHAQWGDKLSMIDIDCSLAHNYVTILKEKYL